jgi:hypothetical protein
VPLIFPPVVGHYYHVKYYGVDITEQRRAAYTTHQHSRHNWF